MIASRRGKPPTCNRVSFFDEALDILTVSCSNIIKMSTTKYRKKLLALQRQQAKLFERLLEVRPILRGTVNRVYTRCGKPNCWCARDPKGHAHVRMTWSQEGKMITRKVPLADLARIRDLTENYRRFRSLRRRLGELHAQVKRMLDCYERSLVDDSRAGMPFLNSGIKNAAHQSKRLQKTQKEGSDRMS